MVRDVTTDIHKRVVCDLVWRIGVYHLLPISSKHVVALVSIGLFAIKQQDTRHRTILLIPVVGRMVKPCSHCLLHWCFLQFDCETQKTKIAFVSSC